MSARKPGTRTGLKRRALAGLALLCTLGGCMPGARPVLSASDQTDVGRVETYLNGLPRFEAHFTQTGDFGPGAGLIWLDRPGRLRIDYEGAAARVMVIAGGRVRVLDRATGALTTMAVSRTPLGLLLAPTITLSGAAHVDSVARSGQQLRLVLSKQGQPGQGSLTLDFTDQPLQLRAVSVTNPYRQVLTMQLSGLDPDPVLTPELFQPPTAAPRS